MKNDITLASDVKQHHFANIAQNDGLTMTSREIADLCNKDHKHVLEDVRKMLEQLEVSSAEFSAQYKDSTGRSLPCFILPKDLTLTLVSGYNVQMRKRIIDRWLDLESKSQVKTVDPMQILNDPAAMRGMLLNYTEKVIQLESKVEVLAPKAEALDRFATYTDGSFCLRDAAKTLQVKEKEFIQMLYEKHWIYRRPLGAGWLAYSDKLQSGFMEHKITTGSKADGSEWASTQPRVTAKGLAKLAEILAAGGGSHDYH
jgi:phage antirepressor YoqD-like protein